MATEWSQYLKQTSAIRIHSHIKGISTRAVRADIQLPKQHCSREPTNLQTVLQTSSNTQPAQRPLQWAKRLCYTPVGQVLCNNHPSSQLVPMQSLPAASVQRPRMKEILSSPPEVLPVQGWSMLSSYQRGRLAMLWLLPCLYLHRLKEEIMTASVTHIIMSQTICAKEKRIYWGQFLSPLPGQAGGSACPAMAACLLPARTSRPSCARQPFSSLQVGRGLHRQGNMHWEAACYWRRGEDADWHRHRITELFGLEGTSKPTQLQAVPWAGTPPTRAGCPQPIQPSLGPCQGWGSLWVEFLPNG